MHRQRFTAMPANVTTQARAGTLVDDSMRLDPLVSKGTSPAYREEMSLAPGEGSPCRTSLAVRDKKALSTYLWRERASRARVEFGSLKRLGSGRAVMDLGRDIHSLTDFKKKTPAF